MDCLDLCADGVTHYQVVLSHVLRGHLVYAPLNIFEVDKVIQFTNEYHVQLVYNERIDCTVRKITFLTTKDFFSLLDVFGDDYDISYKQLRKDLFK